MTVLKPNLYSPEMFIQFLFLLRLCFVVDFSWNCSSVDFVFSFSKTTWNPLGNNLFRWSCRITKNLQFANINFLFKVGCQPWEFLSTKTLFYVGEFWLIDQVRKFTEFENGRAMQQKNKIQTIETIHSTLKNPDNIRQWALKSKHQSH